jgi:hypothetical protein
LTAMGVVIGLSALELGPLLYLTGHYGENPATLAKPVRAVTVFARSPDGCGRKGYME